MNNTSALNQLRKTFALHVAQSPDSVTIRRSTDSINPFAPTVTIVLTARLSHERSRKIDRVGDYPSGLDTDLGLFLQWPWNIIVNENEVIQARGKLYKVGVVDPIKKFGGVHCHQAPLYPAGDASGWVTVVSLNGSDPVPLGIAGTYQLIATITPPTAVDTAVTWASSNAGVVTVDSAGLVTAVGLGTATVTVTTHDGSFIGVRSFEVI